MTLNVLTETRCHSTTQTKHTASPPRLAHKGGEGAGQLHV